MTTPTGTIGLSDVNVELGRAYNTPINLNESAVRSLAGVPSGSISMENLRGKTYVQFWYSGHAYGQDSATAYVYCNVSAAWYVDGVYHSTDTSVALGVSTSWNQVSRTWQVYGVANGVTSQTFTVYAEASGYS